MAAFIFRQHRFLTWGILILSTLFFYFDATAATHHANEQSLDNIVAIVNDSIITQTELNQAVHLASQQMSADHMTQLPVKALRKQMLKHLINEKLQLEIADQSGIHVDDADLDKVVHRIARDNGISVQEFYKRVALEGLSMSAYRKQIQKTLILQRLQQREVASKINVSQEEITDFLKSSSRQNMDEKEYHIQDILITVSDSASPQELAIAKKFTEDLANKLRKGSHLSDLSTAETESLQNNDLNWRKLAEVPTAFTKPVTQMKLNEYSTPVQTANGFHIVHLVGLRNLPSAHKLPQRQEVAQLLFQRKFEEAVQGWLAKVRGQAFIMIQDKSIA